MNIPTDVPLQRLLAFRRAVYEQGFTRQRDSQFEVLDALLLCGAVRSFPELSCLPVFRRRWPSVYAALEDGRQDTPWLHQYLIQQLPTTPGIQVFVLDGTAWPRPSAATLPDRQYVYSPTKAVNGGSVVVGSPYSLLTWVAEPQSSWALPLDVVRIASNQDALTVGIAQIQRLCQQRQQQMPTSLPIVVADAKYGTHQCSQPLTRRSLWHPGPVASGSSPLSSLWTVSWTGTTSPAWGALSLQRPHQLGNARSVLSPDRPDLGPGRDAGMESAPCTGSE